MENKAQLAPEWREVIREDAQRTGEGTKAPDYAFKAGRERDFFVEAKKPSINLKDNPEPAYQLRRYGWNAKMAVSILTDFQEFAFYDCREKPKLGAKASDFRIEYFTCDELLDRLPFLWNTFTKEAIKRGAFVKYSQGLKGKRGTAQVDEDFLVTLEGWREELAKHIALRNTDLIETEDDLNFAVQTILDRLIFLRMAEDRQIEDPNQLLAIANVSDNYSAFMQICRRADAGYNSGLFDFSTDKLTPRLSMDSKVLKGIIEHLYYPKCDYEFRFFPHDLLGSVYERFLGKVIRLTAAGRAKVEEKPEVKKAGGVYYTPTYIVDYIVKQTVDEAIKGKSPKEIAKFRVLDPACGSGSFLLGAYDCLLRWYRDWYVANDPEKYPKAVRKAPDGWDLTVTERKRILTTHIYGVDLDRQAVEVTKLSLLLKVLEGANRETLRVQKTLFGPSERYLPNLDANIKCGNSLIGSDYTTWSHLGTDAESRLHRANPFDWKDEFSEAMKVGGFDVVIGNPPYVRQETLSEYKDYFQAHYEAYDGTADLYAYFMEKGVKLLRDGGRFGIIVSSSFLRATYATPLRRTLNKYASVRKIVDFGGLAVFESAKDTYVCVPLLIKDAKQGKVEIAKVETLDFQDLSEHVEGKFFTVAHTHFSDEAWVLKSEEESEIFEKIVTAGRPLGEYVQKRLFYGIKTGLNEAFVLNEEQKKDIVAACPQTSKLIHPFLGGQDIRRYHIRPTEQHLVVFPAGWTRLQMSGMTDKKTAIGEREAWAWLQKTYPPMARHLVQFEDALRKRQDQGDFWWELRPCVYYQYFDSPKLIFPDICKEPRFYLDPNGYYLANTAYCIGSDDRYLLGVLNSRLFWFAISNISIPFGIRAGEYRYRLIYQYMEKVPIRVINPDSKADKQARDQIIALVEKMLAFQVQLPKAKTPGDQDAIQRQITSTDAQINCLVYDLYGLTDAEIKIVEGKLP